MKKLNPKDIFLILLTFIIMVSTFYILIGDIIRERSLNANLKYTNAVIVNFSSGPRLRYYVEYKFSVNNNEYQGSGKHYPNTDVFSINDTILVVYDKSNPNNNKPWRDN